MDLYSLQPKLHQLDIKNKRYLPYFKPQAGKLIAHYNGAVLTCSVVGVDITCQIEDIEGSFTYFIEQAEPGWHTWQEIWEKVLTSVISVQLQAAVEQKRSMEEDGRCCKH